MTQARLCDGRQLQLQAEEPNKDPMLRHNHFSNLSRKTINNFLRDEAHKKYNIKLQKQDKYKCVQIKQKQGQTLFYSLFPGNVSLNLFEMS